MRGVGGGARRVPWCLVDPRARECFEIRLTLGTANLRILSRKCNGDSADLRSGPAKGALWAAERNADVLADALGRLRGIAGIAHVRLDKSDIVRHRLVQNIVDAYERTGGANG